MNLIITGQSMPENCGKCFYNPYCEVYIKAWSEKPSIRYSFGQHNRLQNCPLIEQVPAIPIDRIKQVAEQMVKYHELGVTDGIGYIELIDGLLKEYEGGE